MRTHHAYNIHKRHAHATLHRHACVHTTHKTYMNTTRICGAQNGVHSGFRQSRLRADAHTHDGARVRVLAASAGVLARGSGRAGKPRQHAGVRRTTRASNTHAQRTRARGKKGTRTKSSPPRARSPMRVHHAIGMGYDSRADACTFRGRRATSGSSSLTAPPSAPPSRRWPPPRCR